MTESTTEEVQIDELTELNKELGRLLQGWKHEYDQNGKQTSSVNKRYSARGSLQNFLEIHKKYKLIMEVEATDENMDALLEYPGMEEKEETYIVEASAFKMGMDTEDPDTGATHRDEKFVAIKDGISLEVFPASVRSMSLRQS